MAQSLKRQTLILTLANAYTRALGFILRLLSARLMGAEALGVMELSSSAIMLAITPVTAGIPSAISRLTAQPGADERAILRAGLTLVKRLSLALIPLMLLLAPGMAWLLGGPLGLGLFGFFLGYCTAPYGTAIPGLIYYWSGRWKNRRLMVD